MCREDFYSAYGESDGLEYLEIREPRDGINLMDTAFVRFILFSPIYIKEAYLKEGKILIFMQAEDIKKIGLWGKERKFFADCEGINLMGSFREMDFKMLEVPESDGAVVNVDANNTTETPPPWSAIKLAVANAGAAFLAHAVPNTEAVVDANVNVKKNQPVFDTTWVLIDYGNNEFRMAPFLTDQAKALKRDLTEDKGPVRTINAEIFNVEAKKNGGLLAAVQNFKHDNEGIKAMMEGGKAEDGYGRRIRFGAFNVFQ